MKMKKESDFLSSVAAAIVFITIGICLIVRDDNGGLSYMLFGVLILMLELVSEKHYADDLKHELAEEQRQQRTIIVRVGEDEKERTTD